MQQKPPPPPAPIDLDALIDALGSTLMEHAAPEGSVDYHVAASAMARILAEMIAPQSVIVRGQMLRDFQTTLENNVKLLDLRVSVTSATGGSNVAN